MYLTLINSLGASVVLSTVGAGIVSVNVPDRAGNMADVVLGYQNPADYMNDGPCAGKIPGRYANRIARGLFTLGGHEYHLAVNCGPNHLHGGPTGFQNRIWRVVRADENSVEFAYTSADGEEGYPGRLDVTARYTWNDACELRLELSAVTDRNTVLNLTNHSYFNLAGHDSGSALDHLLQLNAHRWLPTDDSLVPSGELADVAGTPMDFTAPKPLGRDIHADFDALRFGNGYDNCWAIDGFESGHELRMAARLTDPKSGRTLEVITDQPGVQVYTGNWLTGSPLGKGGYEYKDYDAVAIECQDFPDAPNKPGFPKTGLHPGETYSRTIIFRFGNA